MTEEEWNSSEDIVQMVRQSPVHDRKRHRRLFATACCRQLAKWVTDERLWDVLAAVERYADGLIKDAGLDRWATIANKSWRSIQAETQSDEHAAKIVTHREIALTTSTRNSFRVMEAVPERLLREEAAFGKAFVARMKLLFPHLLRDIFGNPFRPVAFDPVWRTSTAIGIASQMYDSRDYGAMPILADALQDAGCEDDAILSHCRGDGTHVRGCWVVDLVLGKS